MKHSAGLLGSTVPPFRAMWRETELVFLALNILSTHLGVLCFAVNNTADLKKSPKRYFQLSFCLQTNNHMT